MSSERWSFLIRIHFCDQITEFPGGICHFKFFAKFLVDFRVPLAKLSAQNYGII